MKVQIVDNDAFNSIDPQLAERYLSANGWIEKHRLESDVAIWSSGYRGEGRRLWLPFNTELADYGIIMGRVIKVLSEVENKSELQVFEDFNTVAIGDVVRNVGYDPLNRESGTLPYSYGEELIKQAYNIVIAAAMSIGQSKPIYAGARSNRVKEYESSLRLGQTEYGSYTVKIVSPIRLEDLETKKKDENQMVLVDSPEPFSRQVTERLVKSLDLLKDIGKDIHGRKAFRFQPFQDNVHYGISANLCDAITHNEIFVKAPVQVSVTWSSVLPKPEDIKPSVEIEIPPEYLDYYSEASRVFKSLNPEQIGVQGYVIGLRREQGESEGTVSIAAVINKMQGIVKVELSGDDYLTAVRAHEEELPVALDGELEKRGRLRWIVNPKGIHTIENPELPL